MNRTRTIPFLPAVLIALALCAEHAAAVDVVVLHSGRELRGEVLSRTEASIRLGLLPGEISLPVADVKEIRTENDTGWYLRRISGRDARVAVDILDSAFRAGISSREVVANYIQSAAKAADEYIADDQPAKAAELCRRAMLLQADAPPLAGLLARAETAERKAAAEAKAMLVRLKNQPDDDYSRFVLGESLRKLGRLDEAFAEYARIVEGKAAFDGGIEKLEELRKFIRANLVVGGHPAPDAAAAPPAGPARTVSAGPLEITVCHDDTGRAIVAQAPDIYARVAQDLGCKDTGPCRLIVLPSRDEFLAATGNRFGDGFAKGDCVWTYHASPAILDNVLAHEFAHVIARRAFGRLPLWLDEGLATRQESAAGAYWLAMRDGGSLSVKELLSFGGAADKASNNLFYASAYGFVDMLIQDGGMKKIRRLIEALGELPPDAAFRKVYGTQSLQELEDRWTTHLQN